MALSFESSDEIASFFGEQALFYKKIKMPREIFKDIEKVSRNDIMRVIRELFRPAKINLAVIGPHKESGDYISLLKKF